MYKTKDKSASELARELGIRRNQLYKWQEQLAKKGDGAFPGHGGRPSKVDDEVSQLKRELKHATEELEILKKAAAYFAKVSE